MAEFYQQTDTAAACAAAAQCSGASLNGDTDFNRQASVGGSAGSSEVTVTLDASAADLAAAWIECIIPAGTSWDAGDWTVRLNVTTSNHQIMLDAIHICRVSSSCGSPVSIGSLTGIGAGLGTAGVQTHTVSGSSQTPSAGDKVIIVILFDNMQAMPQDIGFTPSVIIDSPFTPAGLADGELMAAAGVAELTGATPGLEVSIVPSGATGKGYGRG